jgi:hypothetical protein
MKFPTRKTPHIPTDLQILDAIYKRYHQTFRNFVKTQSDRSTKIYVPIDIKAIAETLGVDGDIVFGRLYYHLENKYGYTKGDGSRVHLFTLDEIPGERHCINFPLMTSILAGLQDERSRYETANGLSALAILVALAAAVFSLFGA